MPNTSFDESPKVRINEDNESPYLLEKKKTEVGVFVYTLQQLSQRFVNFFKNPVGYASPYAFLRACQQVGIGFAMTFAGLIAVGLWGALFIPHFLIWISSANSWTQFKEKAKQFFTERLPASILLHLYILYIGVVNLMQLLAIPFQSIVTLVTKIKASLETDPITPDNEPPKSDFLVPLWQGENSLNGHIMSLIGLNPNPSEKNANTLFRPAGGVDLDRLMKNRLHPKFAGAFSQASLASYVAPYKRKEDLEKDGLEFITGLKDIPLTLSMLMVEVFQFPIKLVSAFFTSFSWRALGENLKDYAYNLGYELLSILSMSVIAFSRLRHVVMIPIRGIVTGVHCCLEKSCSAKALSLDGDAEKEMTEIHPALSSMPTDTTTPVAPARPPTQPAQMMATTADVFVNNILNSDSIFDRPM